jgi:DNA replication and repair protein RecF
VKIDLLRVTNLRCFEGVSFAPGDGVNWLVGQNGAGKSTLLEAAYILSHGRSFRAGGRGAPSRHGTHEYLIHAVLTRRDRSGIRLGLARKDERWQARLDGADVASLAPLFGACPVVCFGPESQTLVTGPAEDRRAFLDWSVFHVEHASLELWRAWRRTLRQRNALLRSGAPDRDFEPWEHDLAALAGKIHAARGACLDGLTPYLAEEADWLVPELGSCTVDYRPGWNVELGLQSQLEHQRSRERERGFTQYGAHRADWSPVFGGIAHREHLSRGQAKAVALVCLLAQARWLHDRIGEYPLLCLDDLGSELDRDHADKVVAWLAGKPLQAWLTATTDPGPKARAVADVFHVEHTRINPALRPPGGDVPDPL